MALPFVSLNAATSTGSGASRDLETLVKHHTVIASVTGSPTQAQVALEGSHDGTTWTRLVEGAVQPSQGNPAVLTATDHLVRYVRATATALSGGSSPTVTATIASLTEKEK